MSERFAHKSLYPFSSARPESVVLGSLTIGSGVGRGAAGIVGVGAGIGSAAGRGGSGALGRGAAPGRGGKGDPPGGMGRGGNPP